MSAFVWETLRYPFDLGEVSLTGAFGGGDRCCIVVAAAFGDDSGAGGVLFG